MISVKIAPEVIQSLAMKAARDPNQVLANWWREVRVELAAKRGPTAPPTSAVENKQQLRKVRFSYD